MDLIDRAQLLQHLEEEIRTAPNSIALNAVVEIKGYVNRMPRVDAVSVRHGHWIIGYYNKCSVCGVLEIFRADYCRYCGAKMDELEMESR